MTSTLTQYEFDRLELALQNSRHHWVQPKVATDAVKRPLQLAFEEIENLRRALPLIRDMLREMDRLDEGLSWLLKFPNSAKARRLAAHRHFTASYESAYAAREILGRKANVCRPDGTEEHA